MYKNFLKKVRPLNKHIHTGVTDRDVGHFHDFIGLGFLSSHMFKIENMHRHHPLSLKNKISFLGLKKQMPHVTRYMADEVLNKLGFDFRKTAFQDTILSSLKEASDESQRKIIISYADKIELAQTIKELKELKELKDIYFAMKNSDMFEEDPQRPSLHSCGSALKALEFIILGTIDKQVCRELVENCLFEYNHYTGIGYHKISIEILADINLNSIDPGIKSRGNIEESKIWDVRRPYPIQTIIYTPKDKTEEIIAKLKEHGSICSLHDESDNSNLPSGLRF